MSVVIGQKAPNFGVSEWVQGTPTNFDRENDHIVLLEVFQVNCPGCFMHAIPEAINIYNKYKDEGVRVLGLATAFEDFDKNTLDNLRMLAETGKVIGETRSTLAAYGQLQEGDRLRYSIPFPLGMDNLIKTPKVASQEKVREIIYQQIPGFDSYQREQKEDIMQKVRDYLGSKEYSAETFEKYSLRGTPSAIVVDRRGILRDVSFGQAGHLDSMIQKLIDER